jgi:hypothetical protein
MSMALSQLNSQLKMISEPISIFFSYSHKDEPFRDQLEIHLSMLKRQGLIKPWNDRMITAGDEWKGQIDENLNAADIVLLLVTANSLASDYCYDIEMKRAMERHEIDEARVIPIILSPVEGWSYSPFAKLKVLPKDGKPVTRWDDRDEAFVNVVQGIREAVLSLSRLTAFISIQNLTQHLRSSYCLEVLGKHGKIRLLNSIEVDVNQLYVDVWILKRVANTFQIDISAFLRLFDFRNDRLGLGERIERDKGMSVANKYSRLFIIGKPGAGKTTFIKHLAVDCCNGQFQTGLVPVLIELRSIHAEGFELINVIHKELRLSDIQDTQWLLQEGKLLVLLDGLDEIPSQFRRNVQSQIRDFANSPEYNKNRFILTCRTQIIEYPPNGFKCVEVADFNERQVDLFISNWFKACMPNKRVCYKKIRQLKTLLSRDNGLCELAKTPIILSLICWVFEDSGDLPKQRSWLYRKGLDLLLRRWDGFREIKRDVGHKVYQSLSLDRKEFLLGQLSALKFQQSENFLLFEEEDLVKQVVSFLQIPDEFGRSVLRAIESQHGLLIERADEIWSFSHLTFQEYFAAKWFVERNDLEGLANQIICANRDRWRQVFLLAMELTPAENLAKLLKRRIDQSILDDPKLKSFMCWIKVKTNSFNTNYTISAVRALYIAFILDPSFVGSINPTHTFRLACKLDENIENSITRYSFDINSILIRNVHLDQGLSVDFALMLILAMAIGSIPRIPQFDLDSALDHICTGENLLFDNKLQQLRGKFLSQKENNQIKDQTVHRKIGLSAATKTMRGWQGNKPDEPHPRESDSFDVSQGCWQVPDQPWVEELRNVLVEYRNIGHDWDFSEEQITKLREYCLSNEFLLSLLDDGDCGVSSEVIEKIRRRLLSVIT